MAYQQEQIEKGAFSYCQTARQKSWAKKRIHFEENNIKNQLQLV